MLNRLQLEDTLCDARKVVKFYEAIVPNCTTCLCNNEGRCENFHSQPIPPEFIAKGCDQWCFDDVPF